jgi:P27 family predicted phage terminase small subunit
MPRKPKPPLLRELEGNRSKTPIPNTLSGLGRPVCSPALNADEQHYFYAICDALPAVLLSRADEQVLERMAIAWSRLWKCRELITEQGLLVNTPEGKRRNPLLMVERDARDEMHRCGEVLGLSPVARSRITSVDPPTSADPTELLLGGIEGGMYGQNVVPLPPRTPPSSRKKSG